MNKKVMAVTGLAMCTLISGAFFYKVNASNPPQLTVVKPPVQATIPASTAGQAAASTESAFTIPQYDSIKDRMLNAIDNYETIKGTYHSVLKPIGEDQIVDFEVSENGTFSSYIKTTDQKNSEIRELKFDGVGVLLLNHKDKSFQRSLAAPVDKAKPAGPRVYKDEQGIFNYVHRQDPAYAQGNDVSFPQKYAFWLNDETKNYSITGQEQILDRNATVIEGKLEPSMAKKHQATTFKMWVDSDTGVLLKLIETNDSNVITNSLEVTSLQYNEDIDKSKVNTDAPSGWTDLDRAKFSNGAAYEEKSMKK